MQVSQKATELLAQLPRRVPDHWKHAQRLVSLGLATWHTDPERDPVLEELTALIKGTELHITPAGTHFLKALNRA